MDEQADGFIWVFPETFRGFLAVQVVAEMHGAEAKVYSWRALAKHGRQRAHLEPGSTGSDIFYGIGRYPPLGVKGVCNVGV